MVEAKTYHQLGARHVHLSSLNLDLLASAAHPACLDCRWRRGGKGPADNYFDMVEADDEDMPSEEQQEMMMEEKARWVTTEIRTELV